MSDVRRTTSHDATSGKTVLGVEFLHLELELLHLEPKSLLVKQENSIIPVTYR